MLPAKKGSTSLLSKMFFAARQKTSKNTKGRRNRYMYILEEVLFPFELCTENFSERDKV